MPDAKQSRDANSSWRAAFYRFGDYTDETEVLVHLHMSAVSRLIGLPGFYREAFHWPDDHKMMIRAIPEAEHAKDEADKGFPLIHAHALLGLWSVLESLIEDAAISWLTDNLHTLQRSAFAKIRVPIVEFRLLTTEEQMAYLITEVQRDQRTEERQGVGRFERILDAIGMSGPISDDVRRALFEAQQVRNTLAHRGGVADRRLTEACPWLKLRPGKPFTVTHTKFAYYQQAMRLYVIDVMNRFLREEGKPLIAHDLKPLTDFADEPQKSQ